MSRIVLFEDHLGVRIRPLSWSRPAWEIRVGLFSLRERLGWVADSSGGILLGRPELAELSPGPDWGTRWQSPHAGTSDLWLAGRLGAHGDVLAGLVQAAGQGLKFIWSDRQGVVAAGLDSDGSTKMYHSWQTWAQKNHDECWASGANLQPWSPAMLGSPWRQTHGPDGEVLWLEDGGARADHLLKKWKRWLQYDHLVLDWIWQFVPATEAAIARDIDMVAGSPLMREPFGLVALDENPLWAGESVLEGLPLGQGAARLPGVFLLGDEGRLFLGQDVVLEPGVLIDVTSGPVILDKKVRVMSGSRLEGPLYLGPGCLVKAGCHLYGGSSFGIGCRLAGEIGETLAMDFVNKQHDGFIGHAVLGSWVNLGALTTCSDLKNNYSHVRVDLGFGSLDTGSRFVGLMAGSHVKTAIGTLFNTGTCVGFGANIFTPDMPPKRVPGFSWGGAAGSAPYDLDKALETAAVVMGRRGCRLTAAHEALFRRIAAGAC